MKRLGFLLALMLGCGPSGPFLPCADKCEEQRAKCDRPGEPNRACEHAFDTCLAACPQDE